MSGVVFILHGGADEKYAAELSAALAPLAAFPISLDGAAQFGLGSVCIVAWTPNMMRAGMTGAVLAALPDSLANAVICAVDGARLPAEFSTRAGAVAHVRGPVAGYAVQLQSMIANRQEALAQRNQRGRAAPELGTSAKRTETRAPVKQHMAVRSAYGLAATLAAVGFVAPAIGERAVPQGASPAEAPGPAAAAAPLSVAETTALAETAHVEPAPAPALDLWLTTGAVTEAEVEPETAAAPAAVEAVEPFAAPVAAEVATVSFALLPELEAAKPEAAGPTIVVAEPGAVAIDKRSPAAVAAGKPAAFASASGADAAPGSE